MALWRRRAVNVGFFMWKNQQVASLAEADIERAFNELSRECGISYVWAK